VEATAPVLPAMPDREFLQNGAKRLGECLSAQVSDQLLIYARELERWNRKINLVGPAPFQQMLENHFLDSLTLLPILQAQKSSQTLLDIGSGAGFPGLVLACVFPNTRFVLAEPRLKKVSFLKQVIRLLHLTNVEIVTERLTKTAPATLLAIGFPLITSRAFANISDFLALAEPFCRPGGQVICMKGPKALTETEEWLRNTTAHHFTLSDLQETALPFSGASRSILTFTKK